VSEHVYSIPGTLGRFLIGYGMLLAFSASLLFLWLFARSPLHRWPAGLCLLGQTVAEAGYLLDRVYPNVLGATDLTVLAFTFTGSMYALALFHFRLFDLVPVGRGTVIDQMQEGMLILDRRRRVLDVNPAAERILGLSAASVRGTDANNIIRSSSGATLDLDVDESEITLLRQQGSPRHYELSISALKSRDVRLGHVVLLHDVSEQRRAQDLLDGELAHAANYVLSLIPLRIGDGEVRTSWLYMPSEQLGGDSLGYHWVDDSHFAFYLLDVSGHGVGPALLSISVLNALRTQCLPNADFLYPEQVLAALNTRFRTEDQYGHFFTIWYGVFDRSDRMLRYASGGHPPAVLIDSQGHRTDLDAPGVPVGLLDDASYDPAFAHIMPASRVYVFSDGCYEIQRADVEWWTRNEMVSYITKAGSDDGFELEGLYRHVMRIREGRSLVDDFSILCVRFV
jgi:PAS domain S-box-containing protein